MRLKFQPQKPQNSYQFFYLFSPKENFLLLRTYSTKNLIPLPSKATLAILDSKKKWLNRNLNKKKKKKKKHYQGLYIINIKIQIKKPHLNSSKRFLGAQTRRFERDNDKLRDSSWVGSGFDCNSILVLFEHLY